MTVIVKILYCCDREDFVMTVTVKILNDSMQHRNKYNIFYIFSMLQLTTHGRGDPFLPSRLPNPPYSIAAATPTARATLVLNLFDNTCYFILICLIRLEGLYRPWKVYIDL